MRCKSFNKVRAMCRAETDARASKRTNYEDLIMPKHDNHPLLRLGIQPVDSTINTSGMGQYFACPRKFLLSTRFRLSKRGVYRSAPNLGSLFHKAMECLQIGKDQGLCNDAVYNEAQIEVSGVQDRLASSLIGGADATGILPSGQLVDKILGNLQTDVDKAMGMAMWVWLNAPWKPKHKCLGTELKIKLKYPGLSAKLSAVLDLLVLNEETGEVWIRDYKTTSQSPGMAARVYSFDFAVPIYTKVAAALLRSQYPNEDWRVAGISHDIILKPGIKQKKGQDAGDYYEELCHWYAGTDKFTGFADRRLKDPPFVRSFIRCGTNIEDAEFVEQVREFDKACTAYPDLHLFPRRSSRCLDYRGMCPYIEMCNSDPSTWGQQIEENFVVKERPEENTTFLDEALEG